MITVIRADGTTEELVLSGEPGLDQLQELVGGYIEVHAFNGKQVVLNEDGRLLGLKPNKLATHETQMVFGPLFGDVVILSDQNLMK